MAKKFVKKSNEKNLTWKSLPQSTPSILPTEVQLVILTTHDCVGVEAII